MDRRRFLTGAACTGVAGLAAHGARAMTATEACHGTVPGPVRCVAGIAVPPPMPVQACRSLCWATCLAYMLRGYGAEVDLPQVLARAGLDPDCRPGDDRHRLLAAAGGWTDAQGRPFLVEVAELASLHRSHSDDAEVRAVIARIARQPVLCGAAGHTTLITEIETTDSALTWLRRDRVTVADPYAATAPLRALTADELARPFWVLGLSVRPL